VGRHRAEFDQLVAGAADFAPTFVARQKLRARQANDHDRTFQVLDQVTQELDRIFIGRVQILTYQAERPTLGVTLHEAAQNRASHQPRLGWIVCHRASQRALGERKIHQLAEEVTHVSDAPVLQHERELVSHLGAGGIAVRAVGDPEACPQQPLEQPVRQAFGARHAPERAQRGLARRAGTQELIDQSRLAHPGGPHHGHGARFAIAQGALENHG
jgi:hypothetical protein